MRYESSSPSCGFNSLSSCNCILRTLRPFSIYHVRICIAIKSRSHCIVHNEYCACNKNKWEKKFKMLSNKLHQHIHKQYINAKGGMSVHFPFYLD